MKLFDYYDVRQYFKENEMESVHKFVKEDENQKPFVTVYYINNKTENIYFSTEIAHNYKAGMQIVRYFFNGLKIQKSNFKHNEIIEFTNKEINKTSVSNLTDYIEDFEIMLNTYVKNDVYPKIVLPQKVYDIQNDVIFDLKQKELPIQNVKRKFNFSDYILITLVLLLLFSSIYFNWLKSITTYAFFACGCWFVYYLTKQAINLSKYIINDNIVKKEDFEIKTQAIIKENKERKNLKENLIKENKIEEYKVKLIRQNLYNFSFKEELYNNNLCIKKGRFEEKFKTLLITFFESKIKFDLSFNFLSDDYDYLNDCEKLYNYQDDDFMFRKFEEKYKNAYYVPDFIFKNDNLCIDIEIDEPYTLDFKPIHCLNDKNEIERNDYFNSKNWIVIRFSENQIATQPINCCLLIASVIYKYSGNIDYITKIIESNNIEEKLIVEKRWTSSTVSELVKNNHRNETLRNSVI